MTTLRSGSATDVGKVRTTNQDVALEDPDLFAIADGMGGHAGGEVAARVAVDSLRAAFQRQPTVEGLRRAVAEANRAVWRQGQSESELRGMGTTLTATALVAEADGRQVIALANVGDSRAYVYSRDKDEVIQVTADHSLAEEKVRQGQLTEAEAAIHPHRHILTRALGVSSDVDVDLWELHLHDGDRILLNSDGLTNEIGDERIRQILGTVKDPAEAAHALVKAALDHGGNDNVTCVVVDVVDWGPSPGTDGAPSTAVVEETARAGQAGPAAHPGDAPGAAGGAAPDGERGGTGATGHAETSNGARTRAAPRLLRAVDGAGTVAGAPRPGPKGTAAGNGAPRIAVVGSPNRAGGAGATGRATGPGGARSDVTGQGAGNVLAANRLQAAELRRLRPTHQDRRRRRRGPHAPRLITVRVVLFVLVVLAVLAGGYVGLRFYAMDEWYVGIEHGHLAVYQGRPGGFLWFKPDLVDETTVTTHEVLTWRIPQLRAHHEEPSLAAAKKYVNTLHSEYLSMGGPSIAVTPPAGSKPAGKGSKTSTTDSSTPSAFAAPVGTWL